jgi:AcrR family transcriptional regulator
MSSGPPAVSRRQRNRDRLLDAAFALFGEQGVEGTAISDVSQRAELAAGTFYNHFRDRAELFAEVVDLAVAAHRRFLGAVAGSGEGLQAWPRLAAASVRRAAVLPSWGDFVIRTALTSPPLSAALVGEDEASPASTLAAGIVVAAMVLVRQRGGDGSSEAVFAESAVRAMIPIVMDVTIRED